ncbi:MAG: prepilin-type N-terminal cleavage/methylation domain-containing protein [Elusimicrobiota bacterium]
MSNYIGVNTKKVVERKLGGFTLIELMVIIVILGILVAVIAPRIPGFVEKSKQSRTKGNLANLRSALKLYYSDNDGKYPVTASIAEFLVPRYMKEMPNAEMPPNHAPSDVITGDVGLNQITPADAGGWIYNYNNASNAWGDVMPNCNAHTDSSGNFWSSY